MLREFFTKYLFEKVILIITLIILLFANISFASNATSNLGYDSRWVKVGNEWKVRNADGSYLSNCWFFDIVQLKWYRIGSINGEVLTGIAGHYSNDSSSMVTGLWTERSTNKSYFFDNSSNLTYGSLIDKNGYYTINGKSIYLEFEQNDASTKGSITVGLSELKTALSRGSEILMPRADAGGSSSSGGDSDSGSTVPVKPIAPKVKRTILYYLIGSDLEEKYLYGSQDLYTISRPNYSSDVRILVFTGGSRMEYVKKARKESKDEKLKEVFVVDWDKNQIWEARKGIKCIEGDFGSESTTDPNTLIKFLSYAKTYYPSDEYNIIFSDHGGGVYGGLGNDKRPNITKKSALSLLEIKSAFDKTGLRFGFIGFDACLMSCVEYLCGLSDYADYFIGSADIERGSWDYSAFEALAKNPKISNENLLKGIIDKYIGKQLYDTNILALFNLKNFKKDVTHHLSTFAKNVYDLSIKDFLSIKELIQTRSKAIEYGIDSDYDFVDIYDFMVKIENSDLPNNIKTAIASLWDAINSHLIYMSSNRNTDTEGYYSVGGISMYFPLECISEMNSSILLVDLYKSIGNLCGDNYSSMLKIVYVRMALASNVVKSSGYSDVDLYKKLKNEVINPAKKLVGLTNDEINKIETNIFPDLLRYRLIEDNANFAFERSGRPGELLFSYDKYLDDYFSEIYTIPMFYNEDGKALTLGHIIVPHIAVEEDNKIVWNIAPREGYWFTMSDNKEEIVVSFYPTEIEIVNADQISENYLFDKEITGYIPAVLIGKDDDGKVREYNILIYAKFEEMNNSAEILGYYYFDLFDKCEPNQIMNGFKEDDVVKPIYNFEDAKYNKEIKDLGNAMIVKHLQINRGELGNESIYYEYKALDAFRQKTSLTFGDVVFKDAPKNINFAMQEYETWYNYTYKAEDNSINISTDVGGHQENISMVVNSVPFGSSIYYDFTEGKKEFSDETVNYFRQRDFDDIATSSITIRQVLNENPEKHYLLFMDSTKNVGGSDRTYSKIYAVYPSNEGMYLFDVALWDTNRGEIYHKNKMINYISAMIKNKYEEPIPEVTITIRPLVINNINSVNEINAETITIASTSELNEIVATNSDVNETIEEETSETTETMSITIEETSSEMLKNTTQISGDSDESTDLEIETSILNEESTSEIIESSIENEEPTSEIIETSIENEEPTSEIIESSIENEEPTSEKEESSTESEEQTSNMVESNNEVEEQTSESVENSVTNAESTNSIIENNVESEETTNTTTKQITESEETNNNEN